MRPSLVSLVGKSMAKVEIQRVSAALSYTALTDNALIVVFSLADDSSLQIGEVVEMDLPALKHRPCLSRSNGEELRIRSFEFHDTRAVSPGHGIPGEVSDARLSTS